MPLYTIFAGIKEIQVFNQQDRENEFLKVLTYTSYAKSIAIKCLYHPAMQFLNNMGTVLVIGYGGYFSFHREGS